MIFSSILNLYFAVGIICLSNILCAKQKAKTVTTLIDAKWEVTPIVLEVAEYISEESKDDFWSYINDVSQLKPQLIEVENDKIHYDTALKVIKLLCFHFTVFKKM